MKRRVDFGILQTAALAAVAACAAVGLCFLAFDETGRATPVVPVLVAATALTFLLLLIERASLARGFERGVESAHIDPATRLPSKRVAQRFMALEFAAAERGRPLTIVLFRLENFRRLAGRHGPDAASRALVAIGAIMRRRTRGMNMSAPYDETGTFVSIIGGINTEGACTFVNRVRKDLATVSIGGEAMIVNASVCAYEPGMHSVAEMLESAEGTLDEAKRSGNNRMVIAGARVATV